MAHNDKGITVLTETKILPWTTKWGSTSGETDCLTASRNVTLTLTLTQHKFKSQ